LLRLSQAETNRRETTLRWNDKSANFRRSKMDATRQIEAENSLINSFAKIRKITEKNELFKYYLHGKYKLFSRL
jgi:hypothetical protein